MSDNRQVSPEKQGYRITDSYSVDTVRLVLGRKEDHGISRFATWQEQTGVPHVSYEIKYFDMTEAAIDNYCQRIEQAVIARFQETGGKPLHPPRCAAVEPSTGQLANLRRGVHGYWGSDWSRSDDPAYNRQAANLINQRMGVSKAQEAAMLAGSVFGWDSKLADPRCYDEQGNLRKDRLTQKKKGRKER